MKKIVLALANLMEADGTLNSETAGRVDLAANLFEELCADWIMFIGWAYRPDSEIAICDAMAEHCTRTTQIKEHQILRNRYSRDTVGDAILTYGQLSRLCGTFDLTVVSTDYHIQRVERIFRRVHGPDAKITAYGSPSNYKADMSAAEEASLNAFEKTFAGITDGDFTSFMGRMRSDHPFYNGKSFPNDPLPDDSLLFADDRPIIESAQIGNRK